MAVTEQLWMALAGPIEQLITEVLTYLPGVLGGILVLLVGYLFASLVARFVRHVLERLKFDKWFVKETGLKSVAGNLEATHLVGTLTKWSVFALFLAPAAGLFGLPGLVDFLTSLAEWIPRAISALLLVLVGLIAAEYLASVIASTRVKGVKLFADAAKVLVLFLTAMVALQQVGIDVGLVEDTFRILLAGLVFGVSLAFGIGFGLGLKKEAERMVGKAKKRF